MKQIARLLILMTAAGAISQARDVDVWLRWPEIQPAIADAKVKLVLLRGHDIRGRIRQVDDDRITLDNGKSAARVEIGRIIVSKRSISGRLTGSAIGAGFGALVTFGQGASVGQALPAILISTGIGYLVSLPHDLSGKIVVGIRP